MDATTAPTAAALVLPSLYALFVWWFSTGVVLYLDGLPRHTFRWTMLGATVLLVVALFGHADAATDTSVSGAYESFGWALLAWGWQEISYYTGWVTGTRKHACPDGCSGWKHFGHALQTSVWHELSIVATALVLIALSWNKPNQYGTWTFLICWWMHESARLNVFLGVRNVNAEWLPDHLQYLRSFLNRKPMNLLFPFSVTASTVALVLLVQRALAADATPFETAGGAMLAAMVGLAILEHWFLMIPLPTTPLWGWAMRSHKPASAIDADTPVGAAPRLPTR